MNQPPIAQILEKLEQASPNSILAQHIKHAVNQPAHGFPVVFQLKTICAIAAPEAKKLLGESLFDLIIKS